MAISDFFSRLGFDLNNIRWSWGAQRDRMILLRTWQDEYYGRERTVAVLRKQDCYLDRESPGLPERIKHLQQLWRGHISGYTVIARATNPDMQPRKIESFREDVIYPINELALNDEGTIVARLGDPIRVDDLTEHAQKHLTAAGAGPFPIETSKIIDHRGEKFSPSEEDEDFEQRVARFAVVEVRPQQRAFREAVFRACKGTCVLSGCKVPEAVEAAHLAGRNWREGHNATTDGVLLRRDLHALYDRGLLKFELGGPVVLDSLLLNHYGELQGRIVNRPSDASESL